MSIEKVSVIFDVSIGIIDYCAQLAILEGSDCLPCSSWVFPNLAEGVDAFSYHCHEFEPLPSGKEIDGNVSYNPLSVKYAAKALTYQNVAPAVRSPPSLDTCRLLGHIL